MRFAKGIGFILVFGIVSTLIGYGLMQLLLKLGLD